MSALPARAPRRAADAAAALSGPARAIAEAVLYASLFDYPLTLAQLRQSLVECLLTPSQIRTVIDGSPSLAAVVDERDGFFFPAGRADLVDLRRRREAISRAFLRRHRYLLRLVCLLPFVRMAALSGSIAHLNLERGGDLDLFIVTRGRRVWSVTVLVILLSKLMRRRRVVCANYVIADSRLAMEQEELFTASQIIHLRPLVGPEAFRALVEANPFVKRIYPNFHAAAAIWPVDQWVRRLLPVKRAAEAVLARPWDLFEGVCRRAYRAYLVRRSRTWQSPDRVRLDEDRLKLHTRSHHDAVMERFELARSTLDGASSV